jgi:hypothetical protein
VQAARGQLDLRPLQIASPIGVLFPISEARHFIEVRHREKDDTHKADKRQTF